MNVRCVTCNTVLAHKHDEYKRMLRDETTAGAALDALDVTRICCRVQFLGHVDVHRDMSSYGAVDKVMDDIGTVLHRQVRRTRRVSCRLGTIETIVSSATV